MDIGGVFVCLLVVSLAVASSATVCPNSCVCTTTPDGLHKATCSNIAELHKFTLHQKHHNINILDLSHNNITKLSHQLDRLTEVVSLDLSTNGFTHIYQFMRNSTKIVHINLSNNRIQKLSMSVLPPSISSIDLSNNLLIDVPSDIKYLKRLEHLELERNPLDCTCENILARDDLTSRNVLIDHVKCATPAIYKGVSWLNLKRNEVCGFKKRSVKNGYLDILLGDKQIDAAYIGKESSLLKSMPSQAPTDLDEGLTWVAYGNAKEDDDDVAFLRAKRQASSNADNLEGSGDIGVTTESSEPSQNAHGNLSSTQLEEEQIMNAANFTDESFEGSGEGSGIGILRSLSEPDHTEDNDYDDEIMPATTEYKALYTDPVNTFLGEGGPQEDTEIPDYITPHRPSVYAGPKDWFNTTSTTSSTTEKSISEKIQIKSETADVMQTSPTTEDKPIHRTGTYVCIVIIVVLLVGLIAFAVVKGQMRKRRDRRLLRQQKRDIEKASKEMVDMNKSLLGKPAAVAHPSEKKVNGRYELVPTHETPVKKSENGNVTNNGKQNDLNQNKSSPRDNNQNREERPKSQVQPEEKCEAPTSPTDTKRDADSLSSEDIFVPLNGEVLHMNGGIESDISQPMMNGDHTDSDFLSPSREYVPVYSPDMGRVRIKMTETPKPKTPVLVTRSRSNAGDIIIIPSNEGNPKSTT